VPPSTLPVALVATDLDGTLLDASSQVTPRAAAAVAAARRAGIHVVPVTGRPPLAMFSVLEGVECGPFAVCSNGAVTVDMATGAVVDERTLPSDIAAAIVARVRTELPGVRFATDNLDRFCFEPDFFLPPDDWNDDVCRLDDITDALDQPCIKLICRLPGVAALDLIAALEDHVGEEAHVTTSGLDWVDIGAPGISKAFALERVCEHLGVTVDEVVAVGDNHNDLSVLGWAGTAMAPDNAVPEVLAMVDRVLPAHDADAVALLLEEVVAAAIG
jgi:Cof subfamily protein (haloacid dehalogenase superfamily)